MIRNIYILLALFISTSFAITAENDVDIFPTADFVADPTEGIVPLEVSFTDLSTRGDFDLTGTWELQIGYGCNGYDPPVPVEFYANGTGNMNGTTPIQWHTGYYEDTGPIDFLPGCSCTGDCSLSCNVWFDIIGSDITFYYFMDINYFMWGHIVEKTADGSNYIIGKSMIQRQPQDNDYGGENNSRSGWLDIWEWDFGDGSTDTISDNYALHGSTTHIYETAGVYSVSLTVTDEEGLTDTAIKTDYITIGYLSGDLNGDGILNVLDVVVLVNIVLGYGEPVDAGDLNGDGVLNVLDVVILVNIILTG